VRAKDHRLFVVLPETTSDQMHKQKDGNMEMKNKAIGALIAFALIFGVVGVVPAMAGEVESPPPGGKLVIRPGLPSEIRSANGEVSPMSLSECAVGKVCAWSGYGWVGQFSWWPASPYGCVAHANNNPVRSGYNGSSYNERIGGWGTIPPHYAWESVGGVVYGELCWGPGI
jgi:hypothetical protein